MISVLIFIGKLILAIVLCTLFLTPITIAMEASRGSSKKYNELVNVVYKKYYDLTYKIGQNFIGGTPR